MRTFLLFLSVVGFYVATAQQKLSDSKWSQNARVSLPCNNWLSTPSNPSYVEIGKLAVTGTTITLEGVFNRTTTYTDGNQGYEQGDVVGKYDSPSDANYLLRPNFVAIRTSNGFFITPNVCPVELNKTYHVALVYDGSTLKYYRNGFLMSQVAATGTLFQNDHPTRIGRYQGIYPATLVGFINEVRIWNVARTQAQIRTYMNSSLPTPSAQTGLQAYYTFDNLLNKQGNSAWNGTLGGSAAINQTNTSCTFVADSCNLIVQSPIINEYTPALSLDQCTNVLTVLDASQYNVGDTVLLMQMKGAFVDTTNTANFGNIINRGNAGNYEYNYIKSKNGNELTLLNVVGKIFDYTFGKVQLIRVPYFSNNHTSTAYTAKAWDGTTGGVLAFHVQGTLILGADIDVSKQGFRGGEGYNSLTNTINCSLNQFYYPSTAIHAGNKGESITNIGADKIRGKGKLAGGGGGGLGHNSGGGGGGNGGTGGFGGYQLDQGCVGSAVDNRGLGGLNMQPFGAQKIFMGSGGGAGDADNPGNPSPAGGNGGGIVIIQAASLQANNFKIISNGENAVICTQAGNDCHDAMGGGGAGGTIAFEITNFVGNIIAESKGGIGANVTGNSNAYGRIGPGGGGGGGVFQSSAASVPANVTITLTGGANGVITSNSNNSYGATPGANGVTTLGMPLPYSTTLFKKNIDSVRFTSTKVCNTVNFAGQAFTSRDAIATWQWSFGNGAVANTQNTSYVYPATGTFTVKLIATDVNGCKDSISLPIQVTASSLDYTYVQNACDLTKIQFTSAGANTTNPRWSFGDGATANSSSPLHIYTAPGTYLVTYTADNPCNDTIKKFVKIGWENADIITTGNRSICQNASLLIQTIADSNFCWQPTTYLNNANLANPTTTPLQNIRYDLVAEIKEGNLVTNGNFSQGNTGFTSDYTSTSSNTAAAQFTIGTNPATWQAAFANCGDHSTGTGNMLVAAGGNTVNQKVWEQSVTVVPNTNYQYCSWIQNLSGNTNPTQLQLSINGIGMSATYTPSVVNCQWGKLQINWNAGTNSTARLSIVNQNTVASAQPYGFALDDIAFSEVKFQHDSILITIDSPLINTLSDTITCSGYSTTLTTTGSNFTSYSWSPSAGLSSATIASPVATPPSTTKYFVTGTTAAGCTIQDSVLVTVKPSPTTATMPDATICQSDSLQLQASGADSYSWFPATNLSNATISNPVFNGTQSASYIVTGTNVNGCASADTIAISVRQGIVFQQPVGRSLCLGDTVHLDGNNGSQVNYIWSPATGLSNAFVRKPVASPQATITYTLRVEDPLCGTSQDFSVPVQVILKAAIKAAKSNDVNCSIGISKLQAQGGVSYSWSPAISLSNPKISNPIASPSVTTTYVVTGRDSTGCKGRDSIVVQVKLDVNNYNLPSAFTPNGDGNNDCFGVKTWGNVSKMQFMIYNRYGEKVFETDNPAQCWNGMYKGLPALPGTYVYYITATTNCGLTERKGNMLLIR